jgi:hypothetical protein
MGDTVTQDPGGSATENGAGPELLVTEMVCAIGAALKVCAVKLRLVGAAEITGTATALTVRDTGSVAGGP